MLEKDRIAIEECLYAIRHILEYTTDIHTIDDLLNDHKTYDAVQMNFIVLGESAFKLSEELKHKLPNVDWRAMKGFRNFIAHDYFGVDENVIWAAVRVHLPILKEDFEKLLNQ
jgi:uncharacterized protein with HEPN domain